MKSIVKKLKKINRLILIGVLITILCLPLNNVSAYTGGLLNGATGTLTQDGNFTSASKPSSCSGVTSLTDNDETTCVSLYRDGLDSTYANAVYFSLSTPKSIGSMKVKSTDATTTSKLIVKFYDSTKTLITSKSFTSSIISEVSFSTIPNVSYVELYVSDTLNNASIYEFDVFEGLPTATTTATASITAGTYELTAPISVDFGETSISGTTQSLTKAIGTIQVGDLTGSSKGWRLQAQSTVFSDGANILPLNSLQLKSPLSVSALPGTTSALPIIESGSLWFLDAGSDITILSAAVGEGMGSYSADFTNTDALTLHIPPSAKTGSYSSTITWKIVVGP